MQSIKTGEGYSRRTKQVKVCKEKGGVGVCVEKEDAENSNERNEVVLALIPLYIFIIMILLSDRCDC